MNVNDYLDAGLKIFGLHGVTNGVCNCGNLECKALFKHPINKNWQRVPHWSDDQIECMHESGQFNTGFGVLCDGLLVVDVDPRNGGDITSLPFINLEKTFTVQTGGGGLHVYYKAPAGVALVSHHADHKGIDFKSSGFVVGCGSMHASGSLYDALHGHPCDIAEAPALLVSLLTRPAHFRANTQNGAVDVTLEEINSMLNHVNPDCIYDEWVRVGMAIHHATQGSGFDMWDTWSRSGKKYSGISALEKHWHSFGKSANPAGLGTLIFYAEQGGYQKSVEFVSDVFFECEQTLEDFSDIDLNMPPDFLGELTAWVNSQCLFPLESLAAATALQGVSVLAGSNFIDENNPSMTTNLFTFCLASSGCGKEALISALGKIVRAGQKQSVVYGGIKSEQELIRNLARNPQSFYNIDELGIMLEKVLNASKSGAHYLEGLIAALMSIYGKAHSFYDPSGDIKDELRKDLFNRLAAEKKINEKTGVDNKLKIEQLERAVINIDNGIEKPFLSICGWSTPVTFDHLVTEKQATNGFIARAVIFKELETNPRRKENFKAAEMPFSLSMTLAAIAENQGANIRTELAAMDMLDQAYNYFYEMGDKEKERSGLEAICRRGFEIAAKISLICAIPSGLRTVQHVKYGFAIAKRDIENKIKMAYSNMTEKTNPLDAVAVKITSLVSKEHGVTRAIIHNRLRANTKSDINKIVDMLLSSGTIIEKEDNLSRQKTVKLFLNKL